MRKHILAFALALATAASAAGIANAESPPTQVAGQSATTSQQSFAASGATQIAPSNTNVSIRVLSPGDDGDVTQTNSAASSASAGNRASTTQSSDQSGSGGVETAKQDAGTEQLAVALSLAAQEHPSNANVPVRVLSPGSAGDVTQSNDASSRADAGNSASTGQTSDQSQSGSSCGCAGSGGVETAQQSADTDQAAGALSAAEQEHPTNSNVSVRVLSEGDDGDVTQSNTAASSAAAGNDAATTQDASQAQGGGVQTAEQSADTHQAAGALSAAKQVHPENTNVSVRVLSPGSGGDVAQSNTATSSASSGNHAGTTQDASQTQAGRGCGCGGTAVQQAKQSADTGQRSGALSAAAQVAPSNESSPVRVASRGDDGDVSQSNDASSSARSGNRASTTQDADQGDASGSGVQVAGQDASTRQHSLAGSAAFQLGASNDASPVRVWSPGGGGSVTQSNSASSSAESGNEAATTQDADQTGAGSSCRCGGGLGVQALGQRSDTEQASAGLSAAVQAFAPRERECGCGGSSGGNVASPVRVGSHGSDGDVSQSNDASSSARSGNRASTDQTGDQTAAGGGGLTVQALGQDAATTQAALAKSLALQLGASNEASPVRVWSPGGGGSVTQSNDAASSGTAGNDAATRQHGTQTAAGGCGCGSSPIQALGQQAGTRQPAAALSAALQLAPANEVSPASVWSPSRGSGSTDQSSSSSSRGDSGNRGDTAQEASQGG